MQLRALMAFRVRTAALALLFLVKLRRQLWRRHWLAVRDAPVDRDPIVRQAQLQRYCYLLAIAPAGVDYLLPSPDSDDSDVGGY